MNATIVPTGNGSTPHPVPLPVRGGEGETHPLPQVTAPSAAQEIASLHERIVAAARRSLDDAIRAGELLSQQKLRLPHGEFGGWLKANVPFSDRTAQNYMRIFRHRDRLKAESVSDLALGYASLRKLSTPKTESAFGFGPAGPSHVEQPAKAPDTANGAPDGANVNGSTPHPGPLPGRGGEGVPAPQPSAYQTRRLAGPAESRRAQGAREIASGIARIRFGHELLGTPHSAAEAQLPEALAVLEKVKDEITESEALPQTRTSQP